MNKICIHHYNSSDWHDWSSWDEFMRKPDGNFLYSDDEAENAIFQDIATVYPNIKDSIEDIKYALLKNGRYDFWEDNECSSGYIEKTDEGYCVIQDSQFTRVIKYFIEDADDTIKYLPVLQFVCLPKYTPSSQRCVCEPFDTYDEAKKWLHKHAKEYAITPFHFAEHRIFPMTAKDLECEWYCLNAALFNMEDALSKWHPLLEAHEKNLGIDVQHKS